MCEYCDIAECEPLIAGVTVETYIYDNILVSRDSEMGYGNETEINYCPMCGRKLEGET